MSYFIKYKLSFVSDRGNVYDLHILQKNYAGQPIVKKLGVAPVLSIEDGEGRVKGSSLSFAVQADVEGELKGLYTTNNKEFKVLLYRNSSLYWQGFVLPELYSENYIDPPYDVAVTASDQLGVLKNVEYKQEAGYKSLLEIIAYTLSITHLDLKIVQHLNLTLAGKERFLDGAYVATEGYYGQSCYDVLNSILLSCNACIQQYGNEWVIMSLTDVSTSYNKDGVNIEIPHAQLGQMGSAQVYPDGSLEMVNKPAVKGVTLNYAHVLKNSFLKNADCQSKDGWQYSFEPLDNRLPGTVDEFGVIYKCNCWQLPQKDVTVSGELQLWQDVNVKADNTYNCQLSVDYRMDLGASLLLMAIIHEGVDGITRRLTSEGWKEGVSGTDRNSYINVTGTPSELWLTWAKDIADFSKYEKATVQFRLPDVDGVLRIGFINTSETSFVNPLSGYVYITKVYLTYMGITGKASTTVVEENATNAQEEISLAYGERVPATNEALAVLNTLRSASGVPREQFSLNNTSGVKSYDSYFLAMLQEMSRYYAVKKMHLQGVVMGASPLHLLYKDVFSGKVMRLVSGEYDLLQDTLGVLLEEVPDAWVDYEPEVYATDNSVPGVSSSGVVTVGGGGGTSLLAVNAKGEVYVKDERVLSGAEADFGKVVLPAEKPEESSDKVYIYSQVPAADEQLDNKAVNVHLMVDELVELRDDFDALNDLLNSDVAGVINTWDEIVDFLNEYGESQDLASILSQMNTDIANRVPYTDFEKLEEAVDSNYKSISNIASTIPTIESNLSALTSRVGNAEGAITSIQNTYVDKASAQEISGVKTFKNGLKIGEVELVWDSTNKALKIVGSAYITKDLSFGGYQAPGGGGTSGGGMVVTIKVNGQEYTSQNGIVTLPSYPSLAGYATEQWVGDYYLGRWGGVVSNSSYGGALEVNRAGNYDSVIKYTNSNGLLGYIGVSSDLIPYYSPDEDSAHVCFLYHTGNFNPANYLPLSGGMISGDLVIEYALYGNNMHFRNNPNVDMILSPMSWQNYDLGWYNGSAWYTLIHSGNYSSYALPLSGGILSDYWSGGTQIRRKDSNNGYVNLAFSRSDGTIMGGLGFAGIDDPIFITSAGDAYISLIHSGNIGSQSVANSLRLDGVSISRVIHGDNTSRTTHSSYGWNSYYPSGFYVNNRCFTIHQSYNEGNVAGITLMCYDGTNEPLYLLTQDGGGGGSFIQLARVTDNVASATKLQTARTIWGQSFDGTGDVSGALYDTSGQEFIYSSGNLVRLGTGTAAKGCNTYIDGNNIYLRYGTTYNDGIALTSSGNVLMGTTSGIGHSGGKLQVYEASNEWGSIVYTNKAAVMSSHVGGYGMLVTSANNNNGTYLLSVKYNDASISGGGDTALLVKDNGNVLMGDTVDNGDKLQVMGNLRITRSGDRASYLNITVSDVQVRYNGWDTGDGYVYHDFFSNDNLVCRIDGVNNQVIAYGTISTQKVNLYNKTSVGTSDGYLSLCSYSNEMCISGVDNDALYINYRPSHNGVAPTSWVWCAGSSNSRASFFIGELRSYGIQASGDLTVTGDITFGSDARYKNKITDVEIDLATIANAPLFIYKWNDREDDREHLGTTAQYWFDTAFKNAVIPTNDEKLWTMSYSEIAIGNTIILAREQIRVKSRVEMLEEKVKQLETKLNEYRRVA